MFDNLKVSTTIEASGIKFKIDDPDVLVSFMKIINILKEHKEDVKKVMDAFGNGTFKYGVTDMELELFEKFFTATKNPKKLKSVLDPMEKLLNPFKEMFAMIGDKKEDTDSSDDLQSPEKTRPSPFD